MDKSKQGVPVAVNFKMPEGSMTTSDRSYRDVYKLTPQQFIDVLRKAIEDTPEEHRHRLVLEISATGGEYAEPNIDIRYWRPETEQEALSRENHARQVKERREARERAEYARLRAKFGD